MLHSFLDPLMLIRTIGLVGVLVLIFLESGIFFGFFLPGDSLLFTAGFLASQHFLNIWYLAIGSAIAAILGNTVGYWFGTYIGPKIFIKEDSLFFKKKYIERSEDFYKKYGSRAIVLARFVPVVRTFAPIVAGVGTMRYQTFVFYNAIGGILWAVGLSSLGYFLGNSIPNIDSYILPVVLAIIAISLVPLIFHYLKSRTQKRPE